MLGGVLLAFTGVEALFADLGAFSLRAIQLSWLCYCYPALLLAYVGQAAYISANPDAYSNPFYNAVPPGMLYPSLVLAVLAAIVASQAIITATFQVFAPRQSARKSVANAVPAYQSDHEAFVLSPGKDCAHLQEVPWPDLCASP